ncbi:hypothetical protein OROHE_019712 [Orobanche hederae]
MSRRLINSLQWRPVDGGNWRRKTCLFFHSPGSRNVLMSNFYGTESPSGTHFIALDCYQFINNEYKCRFWDGIWDELQDDNDELLDHAFDRCMWEETTVVNSEPQPLAGSHSMHSEALDYSDDVDVFTVSLWDSICRSRVELLLDVGWDEQFDEFLERRLLDGTDVVMNSSIYLSDLDYPDEDYSDDVDVDVDVDVFTPSGLGSYHERFAKFLKSGMLLDTDNDTSKIQLEGGHVREFPRSDSSAGLYSLSSSTSVCWLASTNAGPSGGFYYLPSVPPDALSSEKTVYLLRWYYSPEEGLGFHGMWIGEIQVEGGGNRSFVCCVQNDLAKAPYKDWVSMFENKVRMLPDDVLKEMDNTWTSRPAEHDIAEHAARQYVRHVVQGNEALLGDYDYWSKATELATFLDSEKLMEIMEKYGFEWGKYYECEDLMTTLSDELEKIVGVTYVDHPE